MPKKKRNSSANVKKKPRSRHARASKRDGRSFPDSKISETFLQFAQPLLETAPPGVTEEDMEEPLKVAFTVWNAVVYADAADNSDFLDGIRQRTAHEPLTAALIEQMIQRKRKLFGDDHRLVGEYEFFRKDGELRFRAEARDPRSSP